MIAFEWPFLHRTIAEIDAAGEWDPRRDTPHHQPRPRRDDDGGEGAAVGGSVHNGDKL